MGLAEKYAAYQTFKENLRGQKLQNDERQRLSDLQTGINSAVQNRAQQTTFAEPQQQMAQPLSLSSLGRSVNMAPDPGLTDITGRAGQSPELATYEAMRTADPFAAPDYAAKILKNAHSIAETGDHAGSVEYVNKALGTNLKYLGTKDNIMTIANGDGTHTLYDLATGQDKVIGTPKPTIVPQGSAISDGKGGWTVPVPKEVKRETRPIPTPDGKMEQLYSIDPNNPSDMIPVGKAYKVKSQVTNINMPGNKGGGKPLPASALKMQQEGVDAIGTASGIRADLGELRQQVETGALDLGPMKNLINKGLNWAGWSTPQSRNLQSFTATLQKLRNDSLRLNKGVQTDGDAQRAWAELIDNINDPKAVAQRLQEIDAINERAVMLHQSNIDNIRNNYGLDTLDTSVQRGVQPAIGQGAKRGGNNSTPTKGKAKRDPLGIL